MEASQYDYLCFLPEESVRYKVAPSKRISGEVHQTGISLMCVGVGLLVHLFITIFL